jgi:hypothetical protein
MRNNLSVTSCRSVLITLVVISVIWMVPAWSQNRQVETQRDIDILETVLCQVLGQGETSRFWGGSCRGMYLEGFGIIFNVPFGHSYGLTVPPKGWTVKSSGSAAGSRNMTESVYAAIADVPSDSIRAEQKEQMLNKVKKDLVHFFTSYAGAVRGLAPGEVMAVMIDWTESESAFMGTGPTSTGDRHFYASVNQEKLAQLRQMQNPEAAIQFRDKTGNDALDQELDIFENILDKAMAGSDGDDMPMPGKSIRSMYLPGYGVVVMMNVHNFSAIAIPTVVKTTGVFSAPDIAKNKNDHQAKRIPVLKENVLDVLTRYGGSLRSLNTNESMFIQVDMSSGFESTNKGFSCKVRMADIEQVYSGKLTAAAFKNTVQIRDF